MFQYFRMKLIPKAAGNVYRNMHIMIFDVIFNRERLTVVTLKNTQSPVTLCYQPNVIAKTIIHIITEYFVLHWCD